MRYLGPNGTKTLKRLVVRQGLVVGLGLGLVLGGFTNGNAGQRNSEVTPVEAGSFGAGEVLGDFSDSARTGPAWVAPGRHGATRPRPQSKSVPVIADSLLEKDSAHIDSALANEQDTLPTLAPNPPNEPDAPDTLATSNPGDTDNPANPAKPTTTVTMTEETKQELSGAPTLIKLPLIVPFGTPGQRGDFEKVEAALRLGLVQSGAFMIAPEENVSTTTTGRPMTQGCFSERCVLVAVKQITSGLVLASHWEVKDSVAVLKLVLLEAPSGKVVRALQVWGQPGPKEVIPFAQEAALRLAHPLRSHNDAWDAVHSAWTGQREGQGIGGSLADTRPWKEIPWLNSRDTVDNRAQWGWAGSGLLLAGLGLAWAQGQILQADENSRSTTRAILSDAGGKSFMRGFFAAPTLGARYAAMGGAGLAQVNDGMALLMNPAGVALSEKENVIAAKRTLLDGSPSFLVAYVGPAYGPWSQGLGVLYEGDALANETTLHGTLATDLSTLGKTWFGLRVGAQIKLYLVQVGELGQGLDRATGRSLGMGLDVGIQSRLTDKISAGFVVRDVGSLLFHTNTFTNKSYSEVLPPEYRLGASYQASQNLLLLLDGQKGLYADQTDHIRLGGERIIFQFLALRCGLHEIFGRETVRKLSVGFGLSTDGMGDAALKMKIAVNYGYEFGLNEDEPLGGGQQFSIGASF